MVSAGSKGGVTKTSVTRMLIGEAGITYKYLGLRLFAHPWSGEALAGAGVGAEGAEALRTIGELNAWLSRRAAEHCVELRGEGGGGGRADFNLTLINRMVNASEKSLRPEPLYELGPASVSWHADSGLVDFSTISVFHNVRALDEDEGIGEQEAGEGGACGWRVALRVSGEPEGKRTPAIVAELPSDSCYHLCDDFNHFHEHAVLASHTPNTVRHSSTHRVAREEGGCWGYLHEKATETLGADVVGVEDSQARGAADEGAETSVAEAEVAPLLSNLKQLKAEQELLSELESEWLRQWWIQGALNARQLPWWHQPIKRMRAWHARLEARTLAVVKALARTARGGTGAVPKEHTAACGVLASALESRALKRRAWQERESDSQWATMPREARPIPCPLQGEAAARELLQAVRAVRSLLAERSAGEGASKKTVRAAKAGQSNWLALSKSMAGGGVPPAGGVAKAKGAKHAKKRHKKHKHRPAG
uniref:Alpha-ketoglutarate-dependent dioxygenase FTO n=1 Tax=Prasinoderma coloniale TaxID=156133 RepID=A0A6U0QSA6_9VIRI